MFDESIKPPVKSDNSLAPPLNYIDFIPMIKFDRKCLKQVANIYIVYNINLWPFKEIIDFTLAKSLLGTAKLTKNSEFGKHRYSEYGFGFHARARFLLYDGSEFGKKVIIFVADMSLSGYVDNRKEIS